MLLDLIPCSVFIFCYVPPPAHDLFFLIDVMHPHSKIMGMIKWIKGSIAYALPVCLLFIKSDIFPEVSHSNFQSCLLSRSYVTRACPTWNMLKEEQIVGKG